MTLLGTREGIPVVGTVQPGNVSDKTLNADMLAALAEHFAPRELQQLVYVTGPNLVRMAAQDLAFVSRLPETITAAGTAKAAAWTANAWTSLGRIGIRADVATYQASDHTGVIEDRPYRLVVYRSSHLATRKAQSLERMVTREAATLTHTAERLAGQAFACVADAEHAAAQWRATAIWHAVTTTVVP